MSLVIVSEVIWLNDAFRTRRGTAPRNPDCIENLAVQPWAMWVPLAHGCRAGAHSVLHRYWLYYLHHVFYCVLALRVDGIGIELVLVLAIMSAPCRIGSALVLVLCWYGCGTRLVLNWPWKSTAMTQYLCFAGFVRISVEWQLIATIGNGITSSMGTTRSQIGVHPYFGRTPPELDRTQFDWAADLLISTASGKFVEPLSVVSAFQASCYEGGDIIS